MWPLLENCLLIFLFISVQGSSENLSFELTYDRIKNELLLQCHVPNGLTTANISFWVNETNIEEDISRMEDRAIKIIPNDVAAVRFILKPRYEGTFYCGKAGGAKSQGVGPIAANPAYSPKWNTTFWTRNGNTVTMPCPIPIGALEQAYNIHWDVPPNSTHYKVSNVNYQSSLTIFNVQSNDYKAYTCTAVVRDPANGVPWNQMENVHLYRDSYQLEMVLGEIITKSSFIFASCLFLIFIFLCCVCQWGLIFCCNIKCPQRRKTAMNDQDQYKDLDIKIEYNIGNGAFGTVFKAIYNGYTCAAKLLTHHAQEMATGLNTGRIQTEALERFKKECNFLKMLKHKNIVQHLATITEPKSNLPILIMELMDCSLKKYLEDRNDEKLSLEYQLNLCRDISEGLAFLHSKEIVHRDLCDDNVLLSLDENGGCPVAKIADFGMSRLIPHDKMSATLTAIGQREVYFPPEARDYPVDYSYSIDVYSFGVIATQIIQVKVHLNQKSVLTSLVEKIPDTNPLKKIIHSCLSEDKDKRPEAVNVSHLISTISRPKHTIIIVEDLKS